METFNITPIENEGKRVLTTAQLAESYETTEKRITENFNRNSDHYTEGKHFYCLTGDELKEFLHSANCGLQNTNKIRTLYLWTEKGALLHAKSLNTDKAWEVYDFLVENYFQKKEPDYSALSPQLQFMIQMEQRQKQLETAVRSTNQRIDDMREVMQPVSDDWRPAMNKLVNRIAADAEYPISELYLDIYDEVDIRGGVHLDTRLEHLRERMWDRGATETYIDRLNKLDVIAQDKKLIAIYVAIVREFAAKYIG
ncbi:MAG: ORF6N domain-containing protein [Oscillospiraceae bacterium]|nr:ORF6N domain-containing protein [Oscillospiraceae bacterium]